VEHSGACRVSCHTDAIERIASDGRGHAGNNDVVHNTALNFTLPNSWVMKKAECSSSDEFDFYEIRKPQNLDGMIPGS
jgi:hypothetical protein